MSSDEAKYGPVRAAQLQKRRDAEQYKYNENLENDMRRQYPKADKSEIEHAAFEDERYMLGGKFRTRRFRSRRGKRRTRRTRKYRQ